MEVICCFLLKWRATLLTEFDNFSIEILVLIMSSISVLLELFPLYNSELLSSLTLS